jgi:hypothetical protein
MTDLRTSLEAIRSELVPTDDEATFGQLERLRGRRTVRRRVTAGVVAALVALAGAGVMIRAFDSNTERTPVAPQPPLDPHLVGSIQVGPTGQTTALVAGFDSLWVTAFGIDGGQGVDGSALLRIDPGTMSIVQTIPVPTVPTWETGGGGLLVTSDSIWIAGSGGSPRTAMLVRVDPRSGAVSAFDTDQLSGFDDIATDGQRLYALGQGEGGLAVLPFDPVGLRFGEPVALSGDMGRQIVAVPGALAVEELSWPDGEGPCVSLATIDPSTMALVAEEPPVADACTSASVAIGRLFRWRGQIWSGLNDRFAAIDPSSALPLPGPAMFDTGSSPRSTFTPDGDGAWFISGKSLARIDLVTGDLQRFPVRVGWSVAARLDDSLWALGWDGTLTRVDLFRERSPASVASIGLEIGLTSDVDAWHMVASQGGVFAVGANELVSIGPATGRSRTIATGPWDYDYADVASSGNQVAVVSERDMQTFLPDGSRLSGAQIKPGVGNLLHVGIEGRWLWVTTDNGFLARVDPDTGRIDYGMPANTGPLVVANGYVVVGNLRLNTATLAFHRLPYWTDGATDAAVVGDHLWFVGDGWLRCVDVRTLEVCGDLTIPRAASVAAAGTHLFVLTATGSTDPNIYLPDPDEPATVVVVDAENGQLLGTLPLPDHTPATISAWNDHAWVGFHDSGRVIRIDQLG